MKKTQFLTVKEASKILKLNIMTVYEYIRRGQLKALKLGRNYRIDINEFNKFIKENSS
jgi:putative molybdopterin biosynthesis protein